MFAHPFFGSFVAPSHTLPSPPVLQAAVCMMGSVGWKERWAKIPGTVERIFNPQPTTFWSEEQKRITADPLVVAAAARAYAESRAADAMTGAPAWSVVEETARKHINDDDVAAAARVCEEGRAQRQEAAASTSASQFAERRAAWLEEAGLPETYPKFAPGVILPLIPGVNAPAVPDMPVGGPGLPPPPLMGMMGGPPGPPGPPPPGVGMGVGRGPAPPGGLPHHPHPPGMPVPMPAPPMRAGPPPSIYGGGAPARPVAAAPTTTPTASAPAGRPAPEAAAGLPEGWAAAKNAEGKTYYYHRQTKKTTWTMPTADTPTS